MFISAHYDKNGVVLATTVLSNIEEQDNFNIKGCNKIVSVLKDKELESYNKYFNNGIYYNFKDNEIKSRSIELLDVSPLNAKVGEIITIKPSQPIFILLNNQELECKKSINISFSVPGKYKILDPIHLNLDHGFLPVTLEITDE